MPCFASCASCWNVPIRTLWALRILVFRPLLSPPAHQQCDSQYARVVGKVFGPALLRPSEAYLSAHSAAIAPGAAAPAAAGSGSGGGGGDVRQRSVSIQLEDAKLIARTVATLVHDYDQIFYVCTRLSVGV